MRVLVMFDLPVETDLDKKEYRDFRKFLIKSGFLMMQESIYTKIALNTTAAHALQEKVRRNKPERGLVQMLVITERQFADMEYVVGGKETENIDSDDRLVVL